MPGKNISDCGKYGLFNPKYWEDDASYFKMKKKNEPKITFREFPIVKYLAGGYGCPNFSKMSTLKKEVAKHGIHYVPNLEKKRRRRPQEVIVPAEPVKPIEAAQIKSPDAASKTSNVELLEKYSVHKKTSSDKISSLTPPSNVTKTDSVTRLTPAARAIGIIEPENQLSSKTQVPHHHKEYNNVTKESGFFNAQNGATQSTTPLRRRLGTSPTFVPRYQHPTFLEGV